ARHKDNLGWNRALLPGAKTWDIPDRILDLIPGYGEFHEPSINVYPLKAAGDTPPLRMIQGPKTGLNWPAHISVDVDHQELYVANPVTHEILVFRASDSGNVAPIRVLKGPHTGIKYPHGVFVDTKNDELVVANFGNHSSSHYREGRMETRLLFESFRVRTRRSNPRDRVIRSMRSTMKSSWSKEEIDRARNTFWCFRGLPMAMWLLFVSFGGPIPC